MNIHLDKLELHGFKSFVEKTVIKFHPGITAVVGPNGCGKSNIVDALLWVLGEQRIKNLRGENNEDLIFSGSSSKKPLGMTEVGVTFSHPENDVYIARRFFRSGESKYILNAKYCRNKDIQEELYNLNLGGRNYFIFEQGSIEKLVSLKPSERRMLIEEASGISQYLIRKKETANKLIIAEQNLDNLDLLSADRESRLRELKNQANYASRYRTLKSENLEYIKAFLYKKYKIINTEFEKHKSEVEKYLSGEMILTKNLSLIEKEYSGNENKKWELDRDLKKNQKDLFELNQDLLSKKSEVEKLKQREEFIIHRINGNEKFIKENNCMVEKREKEIEKLMTEISSRRNEYKLLLNNFEIGKEKISEIRSDYKKIVSEKQSLKSELFSIKSIIASINNEVHENEKRSIKLENEINSKTRFVKELRDNIDNSSIETLQKKHNEMESSFIKYEKNLSTTKIELDQLREKTNSLNSQIQRNNNDIDGLKKQRENYLKMKSKISGHSSSEYKKLLELIDSKKENLDLIENFYFEEIGSYIIVENKDLNNPDLERIILNFPLITSIPEKISKEEGYIDHVKNLFTTKNSEIKNNLKDGILVTDLKKGINIFKKFRIPIVTPNAEVITSDGVLIRKRGYGVLDIVAELRNIDRLIDTSEKRISELTTDLNSKKSIKEDLEKKFLKESQFVKELEHELIRSRSSLENLVNLNERNQKRIRLIEAELERDNQDIKKFSEQFKIKTKEKEDIELKNKELFKDRESVEEMENKFNIDLSLKEKEFFRVENNLNLSKQRLTSIESELLRLKKEKTEQKTIIEEKKKEIKELSQEIDEIKESVNKFKSEHNSGSDIKTKSEKIIKNDEVFLDKLNSKLKEENDLLTKKREELDNIKEMKSKGEIELAALKKDIFSLEELSFRELNLELKEIKPDEKILNLEVDDLEENISSANDRLLKMRDSNRLNFSAESEYDLLAKDYEVLIAQKSDVLDSIEDMNSAIKKIDDESKASFKSSFEEIRSNFQNTFRILFEGGEADLALTDPENILETGLEIMAQPPGKKLQGLRLLSGGEKTLTSLAFLFALFEYKPSPFCVFDEVDASLDEANIQRFLKFLHKLKEKTQFLIITHNFKTMEEADYIYGISMNEPSVSSVYSMKMNSKNHLTPQ